MQRQRVVDVQKFVTARWSASDWTGKSTKNFAPPSILNPLIYRLAARKKNETKEISYATKSQRELIELFNEFCKKALHGVMQKDRKHSDKYAIRAIDLEENYLKRGPRDPLANLCHS